MFGLLSTLYLCICVFVFLCICVFHIWYTRMSYIRYPWIPCMPAICKKYSFLQSIIFSVTVQPVCHALLRMDHQCILRGQTIILNQKQGSVDCTFSCLIHHNFPSQPMPSVKNPITESVEYLTFLRQNEDLKHYEISMFIRILPWKEHCGSFCIYI